MFFEMYGLLLFEPLCNPYLGKSKMVKETVRAYLPSGTILANLGHMPNKLNPLRQEQRALLGELFAYFTEIGSIAKAPD